MRSYNAARNFFSFIELVGWGAIILGASIGMLAGAAAAQGSPIGAVIAAVPGIIIGMVGFFVLVHIQMARASVDSAEYAQQSLQLSRDQYEISKQLLAVAAGGSTSATYAADTNAEDLTNINFDTETPQTAADSTSTAAIGMEASTPATLEETTTAALSPPTETPIIFDLNTRQAEPEPVAVAAAPTTLGVHHYSDTKIEERDGAFHWNDRSYDTLIDAKLAIDGARLREKFNPA